MPDSAMLALTIWGAVAQTVFIALYTFRPWWRVFVGRALFTKSLALAVLLDLAVLRHFFPAANWLDWVFDVAFTVVILGITLQLAALVQEIRHDRLRWRNA